MRLTLPRRRFTFGRAKVTSSRVRRTLKDGSSRRCTASFLKPVAAESVFRTNQSTKTAEDLPNVPADCADRIDSRTLLRILGEIDEDFRAPLVLYYMEDLSYKEIADVLALPLGTVQSRIARAKVQLLRRLSETNLPLEQTK